MRSALPLLLLLLRPGLFAAQEIPRIRNFHPEEYRGQNQNWALAQNPQGFLYAANNGGLLECNGSRWQLYSLPESQTVRAVATGQDNRVYCGGFAEFGYWQPDATNRLQYYSLSRALPADQVLKEEIWHILVCEKFVLFQSFSTIYKYDFQKITVLRAPNSIMFAQQVEDRIIVPVIGQGLYELLLDDSFRFIAGTEPLADKIVQFLVSAGSGQIWVGTTNHGMFTVQDGRCIPWDSPLNAVFKKYQLNKALTLRHGGWAIGTILDGVYILDDRGRLRFHLNRENGLQNNTILALHEDRQGNLGLGLDCGIDLVMLTAPMTFFTDISGKIGTVYAAAQWRNQLYLGTNQGVFVKTKGGFRLLEGTQGQVWQLNIFGDQLLCGHNSGTFRILETGIQYLSDITGGWCSVPVPGHSELLLQSTYTGLVVFRRDGGWRLAHRVAGFSEPLRTIRFDTSGNLWGCHPNKGLYRLQLSADLKQVIAFKVFTRQDGLPADYALDLVGIAGKNLINTRLGPVEILDSAGQIRFRPLSPAGQRQKWLPGAGSDFFAIDSSGVTLLTSRNRYTLPLQLVPRYEHIEQLDAHRYLFCLENGYAILDKNRLSKLQPDPPPVYICQIETNSGQQIPLANPLELPYRENSIRVYYASPRFESQPLYSWKLDGLSSTWSPWQTSAEKEFINLPAGRYIFRVRSSSGGPEAVLHLRILVPWYRSPWAIAGYCLLLLLAIFVLEKMSQLRLLRQRRKLEAEKQRELTRQRMESEHEKLALELENKTRALSNAALSLVRKNEALQHLRDELLQAGNNPQAIRKLVREIDQHLEGDHEWELFEAAFNQVHDDFFKRLLQQFPELTPGDLRLAAYLKLNLASKEIAPLLNISLRGVENKRYRLRKKLDLPETANLTEFILGF